MKKLSFIRGRRFTRDERGGTIAELAILIPFLIVMVATVAELGRLFQTYTSLSKSTRAAARYLSNNAYDENFIGKAKQMALCGKISCASGEEVVSGLKIEHIDITSEGDAGNPSTVTVSIKNYDFEPIFNLAALLNASRFAKFPVRPSTTMYYMWTDPASAEE